MTPLLIPYPEIDPILVQLGPFAIRWYALAYIAGLVIGWQVMRRVCAEPPKVLTPLKIDDFLLWAALGVILGGRLGYVLFYQPGRYLSEPLEIFAVWHGGMSFHGGLTGAAVAMILFARRRGVNCLRKQISLRKTASQFQQALPLRLGLHAFGDDLDAHLRDRLAVDGHAALLDEPLAFLDYPSRTTFLKLLHQLAKNENKCIVYSSHDLHLSLQYCDQVMALTQSEFLYYRNPSDIDLQNIFPETA